MSEFLDRHNEPLMAKTLAFMFIPTDVDTYIRYRQYVTRYPQTSMASYISDTIDLACEKGVIHRLHLIYIYQMNHPELQLHKCVSHISDMTSVDPVESDAKHEPEGVCKPDDADLKFVESLTISKHAVCVSVKSKNDGLKRFEALNGLGLSKTLDDVGRADVSVNMAQRGDIQHEGYLEDRLIIECDLPLSRRKERRTCLALIIHMFRLCKRSNV